MNLTRRLAALAVLIGLAAAAPALAGNPDYREYILFNGSNTSAAVDTVEQASPWFYVRGAVRVDIRVWSANTSAWTAADSAYADSITTFKVLFSDSICCTVADYRGTTTYPSAADSLMFDMTGAAGTANPDSAAVGVGARKLPINKPIASDKTGSGRITTIYPIGAFVSLPTVNNSFSDVFAKQWMRIRWQPLRRNTLAGNVSTQGLRTVGIRGLRMRAYVYYPTGSN